MKFQFELSLTEAIAVLIIMVLSIVAAYTCGTYDGFTSRDAQVNELRDAYRDLSASGREGKKARTRDPAKKAKTDAVTKPGPQELWIRLQNADKKQKVIVA
ncbi:MAG: hypothetical protein WCT41_02345 [Candidatus Paceibacterota bacterium]|jgi:hypothetical protein